MPDKVLFLDRDGPINTVGPKGFVHKPEYFHFTDGIFKLCREAIKKDYKIIVITNQTGIGYGDYTEKDMLAVHDYMRREFKKHKIDITDIFYTKYPTSPNRKPSPGMFRLAKEKYELTDFDMFMSVAVGDRKKDAEAALQAGVGSIIYYQTSKVLDANLKIQDRYPRDSEKEIAELTKQFQTLAIIGSLIKTGAIEQQPRVIVKQQPKMFVINDYKQLQGRL